MKSIAISLTPERKAFWFFFARPELTLARWAAYVVILGLTYAGSLMLGLSQVFCLAAMFAEIALFFVLHFSAYRSTMKVFRSAFQLGRADKILAALDKLAEELRSKKLLQAFRWFMFADNAYPRDLYVESIAACFAKWAAREDEAQDRFDAIAQKCDDHVLAWLSLAELHAEGGDVTTALHCFGKVEDACYSFGYAKLVKAAWLCAFEKNELAMDEVAAVSARDKARYSVLPHIAVIVALSEDRTDAARAAMQQALDAKPVEKVARRMCKVIFPEMYKPVL